MPSNVLVSGIGVKLVEPDEGDPFNSDPNGIYIYNGLVNDRSSYLLTTETDSFLFQYTFGDWNIASGGGVGGGVLCSADGEGDVAEPWLVTSWIDLEEGWGLIDLSVTEIPDQNTFGLPAESVALITSRFGSVANFLRLRNQGQV
jgi:hypothetical protein